MCFFILSGFCRGGHSPEFKLYRRTLPWLRLTNLGTFQQRSWQTPYLGFRRMHQYLFSCSFQNIRFSTRVRGRFFQNLYIDDMVKLKENIFHSKIRKETFAFFWRRAKAYILSVFQLYIVVRSSQSNRWWHPLVLFSSLEATEISSLVEPKELHRFT